VPSYYNKAPRTGNFQVDRFSGSFGPVIASDIRPKEAEQLDIIIFKDCSTDNFINYTSSVKTVGIKHLDQFGRGAAMICITLTLFTILIWPPAILRSVSYTMVMCAQNAEANMTDHQVQSLSEASGRYLANAT